MKHRAKKPPNDMRFRILHESKGRVRLQAGVGIMTVEQADMLEAWLLTLPGVDRVTIHERIRGVIILFHGDRGVLYRELAGFSFEGSCRHVTVIKSNSRAITLEYKEKFVSKVIMHYAKRLFLPLPLRRAINLVMTAPRIIKAVKTMLRGKLNVDVLDGIALSVSMITGDFKTAGSVRFLLSIGETLERWTRKKSVDDLAKSMSLNIDSVWLLADDNTQSLVPLEDVRHGDRVMVHTGHVIPVDGVLEQGDVMLNQSSLTGESVPMAKHPGATVYAGSVVEEGSCVIRSNS